jgi:hypothetical protein
MFLELPKKDFTLSGRTTKEQSLIALKLRDSKFYE